MPSKREYKVPVSKEDGSLLHYPPYAHRADTVEWREPFEFDAELVLDEKPTRGRSAAFAHLTDANNGRRFPIFFTDLVKLARSGRVRHGGHVSGRWLTTKRGQNFGVRLLPL